MINDSIFPRLESWKNEDGITLTDPVDCGLSKRELFAAMIAQGCAPHCGTVLDENIQAWIKVADALISALEKKP